MNTGTAIAQRVEQIRQVQSAQVSRDWPDPWSIAVTRAHARRWPSSPAAGYELIDRHGVAVVRIVPAAPGRACRCCGIRVAAVLRGSPAVHAAAAVLASLPGPLRRASGVRHAPTAASA